MSEESAKKELEKIAKKLTESAELSVESVRRQQVASEKLYGWMIEWVQKEREKLKERGRLSSIFGINQRIVDLRTWTALEFLSTRPSVTTTQKIGEIYEKIRADLIQLFSKEDPLVYNLPYVSMSGMYEPQEKLKELNLCLGQLLGYVLGKVLYLA